jgi:hypothetical protein
MKKWFLTPLAGFAVLFAASVLQATPLLPGGNVVPSPESALPAGSYALSPETIAITGINALGQTRFTGTLTFAVYREAATGFLDFLYQYHNNASSISRDPIQHVSSTDFGGNFTDVTYIRTTAPSGFVLGAIKPTDGTRSPGAGSVVSFDFTTPQSLPRGRTSLLLVIHTHATDFVMGTTSVIDGAVATVVTRGPTRIGPEPATLTLFGGGLLGLAGLFGRRWLKQAPVVA